MSGLRSMRQGQDSLWSWAVSAALHTLAIGTAAPLLLEFTILPNQDTFRWDVTIRDAPPPEALAAEVPTALPSGDSQAPPLEDLSTAELEALRPHPTFEAIDAGTPSVPASLQEADRATPSFPAPVTGAGERAAPLPEPSSPSTTVSRPSIAPAAQSHEATPLGASGSAALPPPELDPAEPSLIAQDLVEEELRRIVHRPQAIEHAVHHRPIQAGYGWLAQSI
jgi:hypothetical protein